jgi:3-oxoacyl-[acyl-carrier protein] reductase
VYNLGPAKGARVLVAGGCGGIGREVVAALVQGGARVAVLDLERSIREHPLPGGVAAHAVDAGDERSVAGAFAALAKEWDGLEGFVNLVGFSPQLEPVAAMPAATWTQTVAGNLNASFLLCRAALPLLKKGKDAALVNASSGLALRASNGYGPYAASKAGIISLTKTLAVENAPAVRANAIAPAAVDTQFLTGGTGRDQRASHIDLAAYVKMIPLGRVAVAADVVGPTLFLLGPASAYMTGQVLYINGGMLTP